VDLQRVEHEEDAVEPVGIEPNDADASEPV
jgi:hypothetical protein